MEFVMCLQVLVCTVSRHHDYITIKSTLRDRVDPPEQLSRFTPFQM